MASVICTHEPIVMLELITANQCYNKGLNWLLVTDAVHLVCPSHLQVGVIVSCYCSNVQPLSVISL